MTSVSLYASKVFSESLKEYIDNIIFISNPPKKEEINSFNDTNYDKIYLEFLGEIKSGGKIDIEGSTVTYEEAYQRYSYFKKEFNGKNLFDYLIEIYNNENGIY